MIDAGHRIGKGYLTRRQPVGSVLELNFSRCEERRGCDTAKARLRQSSELGLLDRTKHSIYFLVTTHEDEATPCP